MLIHSGAASIFPLGSYALGEYLSSEGGYYFGSQDGWGYVFSDPTTELNLDYFGAPDGSGASLLTDFGAGVSNTQTIITITGLYSSNVSYIVNYAGSGKTDWFIGSRDEIDTAYNVAIGAGFSFPVANPTYPTLATSTAAGCGSEDLQIKAYLRQTFECMDRTGDACYGWPIRRFRI